MEQRWRPGSTRPEPEAAALDRYGRGEYDPITELWDEYEIPQDKWEAIGAPALTWEQLFERWHLVECDFHSEFGVDLDEPGLLRSRSWRWFRARIAGLVSADTRIYRALAPKPSKGR